MNRRSAFFKSAALPWMALAALFALLGATLSACSPGHVGGNEIAFLRGNTLWEVDQDGSNLHQIASDKIIGFSWSPNHHQIVVRLPNGTVPVSPSPYGSPDLKSELNVTSIDGSNLLQITPPDSGLARSDAWWDASGNRLLYREEKVGTNGQLEVPHWELSQADQPAGIARKDLPTSAVLPAVNSDGSSIASIDSSGKLLVGTPGGATTTVATGALLALPVSAGYPARPLWQPGTGALLYAVASAGPAPGITTLVLRTSSGTVHPLLTTDHLQQYDWSPNGGQLLVRTASDYRIYSANGAEQLSWSDTSATSLPFWSPDSRWLLILEPDQAVLVNVATHQQQTLLHGTFTLPQAPNAQQLAPFLRPATSSPWNSDSSAFLLSNNGQGSWAAQPNKPLPTAGGSGDGLYLITLGQHNSAPAFPALVDWGQHQNVAWTTLDPNCAFLIV